LTDTELLFLNRKDRQKIYALHLGNAAIRKLTDKSVLTFHYDKPYIFYVNQSDLKNYRIDMDGQLVY